MKALKSISLQQLYKFNTMAHTTSDRWPKLCQLLTGTGVLVEWLLSMAVNARQPGRRSANLKNEKHLLATSYAYV